ncbi:hypothetical protein NE237_032594 [Protea cynaroides]|uniref:Uncharacterized protein n=1 Tax=Protea cynaroides TaxID=273540 RepID=A0A9Q0L3E4_9MAGN|nr:hypothetical protein NE237_032594 [Protea cynaroides]
MKMGSRKTKFVLLLCLWASNYGLCLCLPTEFSILGYETEELLLSEDRVADVFMKWKEKYGKDYKQPEEEQRRFEKFKKNLKYVIEKNSKNKSPLENVVGLNKFADMSNEEFKELYMSKMKKPIEKKINGTMWSRRKGKEMSCKAHSSLDWRKKGVVTAVKDQGGCGSCWAFSSTGAIESINAIVTKDLISLSEQELVNCDSTNEGCEGGDMDYAFEWVISNGGIDTELNYPYTGLDGTCDANKEKIKVVSIDGFEDVAEEESALLCAVVQQPVSVGIDGSSWDFQLYTGGIYDGDCSSDPNDIDHAVLIVGYASQGDKEYWIVKNSWGTDWGIDGYIYIRRKTDLEYGVCAINAMASYPTKESVFSGAWI